MIEAVGVVVPARDEESSMRACLDAIGKALRLLPARFERAVCVVADRCSDRTAEVAEAAFGGWRSGSVCRNERHLGIGAVRALGVHACLSKLSTVHSRTLLLNTDADSQVDPQWALAQVDRANEGNHSIAGSVELANPTELGPLTRCRYQAVVDDASVPEGHGNVYGANFGVRADAYAAVGGFAALPSGEDHDLWKRLGRAGFRRCYDETARVLTSARLSARAPDGLGALLRRLAATPGGRTEAAEA